MVSKRSDAWQDWTMIVAVVVVVVADGAVDTGGLADRTNAYRWQWVSWVQLVVAGTVVVVAEDCQRLTLEIVASCWWNRQNCCDGWSGAISRQVRRVDACVEGVLVEVEATDHLD